MQHVANNIALDDIASQIQNAVQHVLSNLESADRNAGDYVENLMTTVNHVPNDVAPTAIRVLVQSILDETHQMIEINQGLRDQLQHSSLHINALSEELGEVRKQASTDQLTGLGNRAHFESRLSEEIENAREKNTPLSLLMIDIDHFKNFNDQYGHLVGDQVLRVVGQTLRKSVKGQDTPARFGGEEFVVLLPNTKAEAAVVLAENIRCAISQRNLRNRATGATFGKISVSLGVSELRGSDAPSDIVKRADLALYAAKNSGRDRVELFLQDDTCGGASEIVRDSDHGT